MGSCKENLQQFTDANMKLIGSDKGRQGVCSSKGEDSNVLLLYGKKKCKVKVTNEGNKKRKPCLTKSQKRKLKKLEEEKKQAALLSESIRTLEKYKIQDETYSLLRSSGNIGQVETMREKRRWAIQFSKAGLEIPPDDQPSKKRAKEAGFSQSELDPYDNHSKQDCREDDLRQPILVEGEVLNSACLSSGAYQEPTCYRTLCTDAGSDTVLPSEDTVCQNEGGHLLEEQKKLLVKPCDNGRTNKPNIQDMEGNDSKVNCQTSNIFEDRRVSIPTIVHVSRPNEVENKRKDLPIIMMEQEIMEAINEHPTVIICGETGCGKTTQVPQFLYEAGFGSSKSSVRSGIIGVTQPRRVAVFATAKRVAYEMGLHLGKEVGFQVRHDKKIGDSSIIKFMTDGILLREAQNDFLLKRYSVIILDEAHERSLNTDILIGMLSRIILVRQKLHQEQQKELLSGVKISPENMISQLKLVLMSATLRVEDFISDKKLFGELPPPAINVPTRQFPVTIHFSKRTEVVDYIGQAFKKVMSIHKRLPPGGILVFVTGQREVEYLCQKLRRASGERINNTSKHKRDYETATSEKDSTEQGIDMKEISEAFGIQGHSTMQQTDRLSSYDEDPGDLDEYDSHSSDDSGTESELTVDGDEADDLDDVSEEVGSFVSLKAAFEALVAKSAPNSSSVEKMDLPTATTTTTAATTTTERCFTQSLLTSEKKHGESNAFSAGALSVRPLYAMLSPKEQLRVFEEVIEGERLVVVATNVAETSLTIPGIKYVVDTGREKVKNYNSSNGMETYEVQWISKASAAQRAGRAGRTGPGHCYRLYSSAVFSNILSDFSIAEISKIPVDGVILLMKSMGIDKVVNFPFPTPPKQTALKEAECCLKALEALDSRGKLTPLGKAMSYYPMSPRHSRMLLTVIQIMKNVRYARANILLGYAVATAAALSLSNPFIMQFEGGHDNRDDLDQDDKTCTPDSQNILDQQEKLRQKKLKQISQVARAKFCNPSSDALSIAYALQLFELAGSSEKFCKENALHFKTMEEMSNLRKQLLQLVFRQSSINDLQKEFLWDHGTFQDVEKAWSIFSNKHPLLLYEEEILGQAICAGWADRIAKRIRAVSGSSDGDRKGNAVRYQACMVEETVYLHRRSFVARSSPEFLVYSELLQTKRPYMHGVTSVQSDWLVKYAGSLCTLSDPPKDMLPYYKQTTDEVMGWASPTFGIHRWQLPLHSLPIKDDMYRVSVFAYALLAGQVLPCLGKVQESLAASPLSFLRREALGQKRVGNLLNKLKTRSRVIDCRAMLRETWNRNPQELYSEILDWFQEGYRPKFGKVWEAMHREVLLESHELFPEKVKKEKREKKKLVRGR